MVSVNPALLYALKAAGVTEVIKVGGAQAIAALAIGTKSIRPVDRIFGPGNRFVVEAKRQLVGAVSIDLLPGPSEILILADKTGNPEFIAADMLAQAEHGGDSVVGFVTDSKALLGKVTKAIDRQLATLSRAKIIKDVLKSGTFLLHVKSLADGVAISNAFCPEHLSLIVAGEKRWLPQIRTAGAIYLGNQLARRRRRFPRRSQPHAAHRRCRPLVLRPARRSVPAPHQHRQARPQVGEKLAAGR